MIKVNSFTSIRQVETAYEAFTYESRKDLANFPVLLEHLKQYKADIDTFARKYEFVQSYFPLTELEKRKVLFTELREMLKSNRATNEELLIFFKTLPELVQNEYRNLALMAGIKNLDSNLRKILLLKAPTDKNSPLPSEKNATLLDKQIDWLTGEISKYKTQAYVFNELSRLKPKIDSLINEAQAKARPNKPNSDAHGLGKTDINDLWWEQKVTFAGLFLEMQENITRGVFEGKLTPHFALLNDRIVKIDEGTKPINAHFAFDGKYIQTACPREYTVIDFYKMIQEQNCSTVVMLNELHEYKDFIPYWPSEIGKTQYYGQTAVVLLDHTETFVHSSGNHDTNNAQKPSISNRTVRISSPGKPPRTITLFQYHKWVDGGQGDVVCVNKFVDMIDQNQQGKTSPVVIHCGAGMGRTGTFTTILKLSHDLKEGKKDLSIRAAVAYQRAVETGRGGGMVIENQYLFCHAALQHRLKTRMYA